MLEGYFEWGLWQDCTLSLLFFLSCSRWKLSSAQTMMDPSTVHIMMESPMLYWTNTPYILSGRLSLREPLSLASMHWWPKTESRRASKQDISGMWVLWGPWCHSEFLVQVGSCRQDSLIFPYILYVTTHTQLREARKSMETDSNHKGVSEDRLRPSL